MKCGPRIPRTLLCAVAGGFMGVAAPVLAQDFSPQGLEFFEKKIRPVLVERCYKCHSVTSEKLKGNLHVDSRSGMIKGGDTRAALVPGDSEKSLLIEALGYGNQDLQMPPKGKLPPEQINDFVAWVKMGAPWPKESEALAGPAADAFDLEKRKASHWCWKPVRAQTPPAVRRSAWPVTPVDHFILARLEAAGIAPAPPADKRALIRRAAFDLTGLPPSAEDVDAFLGDRSEDAFGHVVDRFLASPRFGERWARHWLDLVRYAETLGHESDYPIPNAWRYRDYVIRAFNADLPYDQFVMEQVAGDLMPQPRRHPTEGFNESAIGPVFYWLTQQTHSPVDVRQHQAELIENQIDVLTKTFQAVTVACARCHDHKFDPISTQDFYALYGILSSSRYAQRTIDGPERIAARAERLMGLKKQIREATARLWSVEASHLDRYLLAAGEARRGPPKSSDAPATSADKAHQSSVKLNRAGSLSNAPLVLRRPLEKVAAEFGVDARLLERWVRALAEEATAKSAQPLFAWAEMEAAQGTNRVFATEWTRVLTSTQRAAGKEAAVVPEPVVLGDFATGRTAGWQVEGNAFLEQPTRTGEFLVGDANQPVTDFWPAGWAHSGTLSRRLEGVLRSPTFAFDKRYLHLYVAGRGSRINLVVDNFIVISDPIYGSLKRTLDFDEPRWITIDLGMWHGHRGYLEFCDLVTPEPTGPGGSVDGYIAFQSALLSEQAAPPALEPRSPLADLLAARAVDSAQALAAAYRQLAEQAISAWGRDQLGASPEERAQSALLQWLARHRLLDGANPSAATAEQAHLVALLREFKEVGAMIPPATTVPGMADGTGWDEHVFIRGAHRNPGPLVPRRFLEALAGAHQPVIANGSGRLELAQHLVDPNNPLTARVMVNRVWHHVFGQGIVPTVDNFGVLGQPPTHPELLDWLADWYRREGGSTKKLIRLLMTSSAYQMSSQPADAKAEEKDPNNDLLHRMRVRRLEGEAIRDAALAVSGRLNPAMFGPPVPVHLTPFLDGRGRPGSSGPLDGDGRRSVYNEVRRNFLPAIMLAFDTPIPASTVGRRSVSNVPAQALILMNDPFVAEQAHLWAKRLLSRPADSPEQRIAAMYGSAFSRPPAATELAEALLFLEEQGTAYGLADQARFADERVWADLGHVLFNVKEFVFVN